MKDLIRKLNTARSMPLNLLAETLTSMVRRKIRRYYIKLFPIKLSDKLFLEAIDDRSLGELPPFFFNPNNKDKIVEIIRTEYPETIEQIINDADEICEHIFDLLGSGETELGEKIDWHRDFKSGFRWGPRTYYLWTGKHVTLDEPSDVKIPWELSRCQHFITLGKAYWLTSDEKYAKEFVDEIESWVSQNPVELGVNWACTMDVAIRTVNWVWGYYFFCNSKTITKEFQFNLFKSLFLHGRYITNNLEFAQSRGNHYLSDIIGLAYLGIFFKHTKDAEKWLKEGVSALVEEIKWQVYPDGVDYEGSISYHRLEAELFLSATLLCLKNSITFPDWYMEQLEKMIEFVMYYTKPDGTAPQIGDNDDGRLHILANYGSWNRLDHRYLLSIGAVRFNRCDFKQAAERFHEEAFWLLGEEGLKKFDELPEQKYSISSRAFPHGGFYIMRSGNLYMIVDCVPADLRTPSGHKHNSRLSFELFAYDKSFIVDPGAYIYTADKEMRNLFRSTKFHNMVVVDDKEQNRFDEDELFSMGRDAAVTVNRWESTEEHDFLDAEHSGYKRLKGPVVHQRQIFFNKLEGYWVIKDILSGEGNHQFDLYFHFPSLEVEFDREFPLVVRTRTEGVNLAIIPLETEGVSVEISEGWVSYRYGVKEKAPIVRYLKKGQTPASFCNIVYPYFGETDINGIIEKVQISKATELFGDKE